MRMWLSRICERSPPQKCLKAWTCPRSLILRRYCDCGETALIIIIIVVVLFFFSVKILVVCFRHTDMTGVFPFQRGLDYFYLQEVERLLVKVVRQSGAKNLRYVYATLRVKWCEEKRFKIVKETLSLLLVLVIYFLDFLFTLAHTHTEKTNPIQIVLKFSSIAL